MEKVDNIEHAKEKVLHDMNAFIEGIRLQVNEDVTDLRKGLFVLRNIRSSAYENLNQIQHEYLILQGLLWLQSNEQLSENIQWYWNPRQTGDSSEPDLRGVFDNEIVIFAEATTAEKPQGVIDSRMSTPSFRYQYKKFPST